MPDIGASNRSNGGVNGRLEAACYICHEPSVVTHKGANSDYGLCAAHLVAQTLAEAWQAVDRAIRPLGHGGGASNSPWNQGYERAKDEALNAISALLDKVRI